MIGPKHKRKFTKQIKLISQILLNLLDIFICRIPSRFAKIIKFNNVYKIL